MENDPISEETKAGIRGLPQKLLEALPDDEDFKRLLDYLIDWVKARKVLLGFLAALVAWTPWSWDDLCWGWLTSLWRMITG